ncbi:MAG: hypothetical protein PVG42_09380, partial [Lysobacterales bacterium]
KNGRVGQDQAYPFYRKPAAHKKTPPGWAALTAYQMASISVDASFLLIPFVEALGVASERFE